MSILSDNLRFLRVQKKKSQQEVADSLQITRGRYAKYEDGSNEPPLELLLKISKFFRLSIDLLITVDVRKYPLEHIISLPDNRIVLPVAVNSAGENTIEVIPHQTRMGYLQGYTDPGYIENLQTISLPFIRNGKYRAFPAYGDSMPPFKDGAYIVGKFVEEITSLKAGRTYVFVTLNEGITYKRLQDAKGRSVTLSSDNASYEPYEISFDEIIEIWEFACAISTQEYEEDEFLGQEVRNMFLEIRSELRKIEGKIEERQSKTAL